MKPDKVPVSDNSGEALGQRFYAVTCCGKRSEMGPYLEQLDQIPNEYLDRVLKGAVRTGEVLKVQKLLDSVQFMDLVNAESLGWAVESSAFSGSYTVLDCLLKNPRVAQKAPERCYGSALINAVQKNFIPGIKLLLSFKALIEKNVTRDQWVAALGAGVDLELPEAVLALFESGYLNGIPPDFFEELFNKCVSDKNIRVAEIILQKIDFGQFIKKKEVNWLLKTVILKENLPLLTLLLGVSWISKKFDQIEPGRILNLAAASSKDPRLVEALLNCPEFSKHLERKDLLLVKEFAESRGDHEIVSLLEMYIHSHFSLKRRADD